MISLAPHSKVWLLQAEDAEAVWPSICHFIAKACCESHGRHSPVGIRKGIQTGQFQLFVAVVDGDIVSACVTTISQYTASSWLTIILCGGHKMLQWLDEGKVMLEEFATANDCQGLEAFGRYGWCKAMDLVPVGTAMERRL